MRENSYKLINDLPTPKCVNYYFLFFSLGQFHAKSNVAKFSNSLIKSKGYYCKQIFE